MMEVSLRPLGRRKDLGELLRSCAVTWSLGAATRLEGAGPRSLEAQVPWFDFIGTIEADKIGVEPE
jgi:hypothetical protein